MLKICYLSFNDPIGAPGVHNKEYDFCYRMWLKCQERGLSFCGYNVFLPTKRAYSFKNTDWLTMDDLREVPIPFGLQIKYLRALFRSITLLNATRKYLASFQPDIVIYRYSITYFPFPLNVKAVTPNCVFVSEHQTKEIDELRTNRVETLFIPFEFVKSKLFFRNVDGIIGVTHEIARYELNRANRELPFHVLSNGIEIEKYPVKKYTEFNKSKKELVVIYIGSGTSVWHGIDRFLKGMSLYDANPRVKLHIVGSATDQIITLVKKMGIENQIVIHGFRNGKELDEIFDQCHIALGSLGIHRKGLTVASTLKVREYMVRGIPFIISHVDEDVDEEFRACLRLPANDDPIDIQSVVDFAHSIYCDHGGSLSTMMRQYAKNRMSYSVKVNDLIDFLLTLKPHIGINISKNDN